MPENVSGDQRIVIHPKGTSSCQLCSTTPSSPQRTLPPRRSSTSISSKPNTPSHGGRSPTSCSPAGRCSSSPVPPPGYDILPVHMAFLCTEGHFDRAVDLLKQRGLDFWADPQRTRPQETNTGHEGRGVYFLDPSGMYLELITSPYL